MPEKIESKPDQLERQARESSNIPELRKIVEAAASEIRAIDWQRRSAESERDTAREDLRELKLAERDPEEEMKAALLKARITAVRALVRLLPKAVSQANKGKPALLRLILRSTK